MAMPSANANGPVPIPPMPMAQCHCQDRWTIWLKNINDSIKIINWLSELDEVLPVAHCQWSNGDPRPVLVITFQCPPCQWPNGIAKGDWLLDWLLQLHSIELSELNDDYLIQLILIVTKESIKIVCSWTNSNGPMAMARWQWPKGQCKC